MVAEAVGFMSRAVDGGMAPELVTRDFLGGCASPAGDDARDAAAAAARHDLAVVRMQRSSTTHPLFLLSSRVHLCFLLACVRATLRLDHPWLI